jgi:hypothetical protein
LFPRRSVVTCCKTYKTKHLEKFKNNTSTKEKEDEEGERERWREEEREGEEGERRGRKEVERERGVKMRGSNLPNTSLRRKQTE